MAETIVFIHGAWLASNSWERFATFFAERGYATLTPERPRKAPGVAAQREDPAGLAGLGVEEIVEHYAAIIDALDEPPIIMPGDTTYTDPLPQALVLTAIVISFGMTALLVVLALRSFLETGRDDVMVPAREIEPEP